MIVSPAWGGDRLLRISYSWIIAIIAGVLFFDTRGSQAVADRKGNHVETSRWVAGSFEVSIWLLRQNRGPLKMSGFPSWFSFEEQPGGFLNSLTPMSHFVPLPSELGCWASRNFLGSPDVR